MSNSFGYLDIILLAMIAGFIVLRLRNILGRKTGHEDKVFSDFNEKKFEKFKEGIKQKQDSKTTEFDPSQRKQFLKGAEIAYENIITAFSKGDKKSLNTLLTKNMSPVSGLQIILAFGISIFLINKFSLNIFYEHFIIF